MTEEYFIVIHCLKMNNFKKMLSYQVTKPIPLIFVLELVTVTKKS